MTSLMSLKNLFAITLMGASFTASAQTIRFPKTKDCRGLLSASICLVNAGHTAPTSSCADEKQEPQKVQAGRDFLLNIYDNLPAIYQKMFCSIPVTYLTTTDGPNTSVVYEDPKTHDQMVMLNLRINENNLAHPENAAKTTASGSLEDAFNYVFYATPPTDPSLKPTRFFFGTQADQAENAVKIPNAPATMDQGSYLSALHEIGHLFDRLNSVNPKGNGCTWGSIPSAMSPDCKAPAKSWMSLSWLSQTESLFDQKFTDRSLSLGYFNGMDPNRDIPTTDLSKMEELIKGLYEETNFLNPLTATQVYDDWAESTATRALLQKLGPQALPVSYITQGGAIYNLTAKFNSKNFESKRKFMDAFFARKDLNFPAPVVFKELLELEELQYQQAHPQTGNSGTGLNP